MMGAGEFNVTDRLGGIFTVSAHAGKDDLRRFSSDRWHRQQFLGERKNPNILVIHQQNF